MRSAFRDLRAYQLACELSDEYERQVRRWSSFHQWSVGLQLVRALDSVAANIAEASGRWSRADKRRVLIIARGSLYEAEHWLVRAANRGLIDAVPSDRLSELARTLHGLTERTRR